VGGNHSTRYACQALATVSGTILRLGITVAHLVIRYLLCNESKLDDVFAVTTQTPEANNLPSNSALRPKAYLVVRVVVDAEFASADGTLHVLHP